MRDDSKLIPQVFMKGSFREMGSQYGEAMASEIAFQKDWWTKVLAAHWPNMDMERALNAAKTMYAPAVELYAPRWADFIEGMAEGAGLPYDDVLWINVASNLLEGPAMAMRMVAGGCTDIGVQPDKTDIGKLIIGQNLDWHPELKPVCLHFDPADAPKALAFTISGALPQFGISENGYGSFGNALGTEENKTGVTMNALTAELLFQDCIGSACERITMADRSMCFNHMLGAADGTLIDFETTPSSFGVLLPEEKGWIAHTNHYITSWMQKDDTFKTFPDTFVRRSGAEKFLRDADVITVDTLKKIFSDHHGDKTRSLCTHPVPGASFTECWQTVYSMISIPEDGVIYATTQPCEHEYEEYRL